MRKFLTLNNLNDVDKKFMQQAIELKNLSLAEDKKVGSIIANHRTGELISLGYNKMFEDLGFHICEDENGQSLPFVIHAEEVAVIEFLKNNNYKKVKPKDLTIYCTYAPCISCAKYLSHLSIKRVIYFEKHLFKFDKGKNSPFEFLSLMGVEMIEIVEEF
jgi:dCMP deaminase